ncbi:hypothetical protein RTBOTA2_003352 [Rhodotorula toruloides]|nr:hypothetical protein RTBOTA2_003352 [Rhodotorula toruloides]
MSRRCASVVVKDKGGLWGGTGAGQRRRAGRGQGDSKDSLKRSTASSSNRPSESVQLLKALLDLLDDPRCALRVCWARESPVIYCIVATAPLAPRLPPPTALARPRSPARAPAFSDDMPRSTDAFSAETGGSTHSLHYHKAKEASQQPAN